jgi:hypothetical protein
MAKPKHAKRDDKMGQAVDAITMLKRGSPEGAGPLPGI